MDRNSSWLKKEKHQINFCLRLSLYGFHSREKMLYHLLCIYWAVLNFDIFVELNNFHDLLTEEDEEYRKFHLLSSKKCNHLYLYHNLDHFWKVLLNLLNALELILAKLLKKIFFQLILLFSSKALLIHYSKIKLSLHN